VDSEPAFGVQSQFEENNARPDAEAAAAFAGS
jgi:hypothetical protein